MVFSLTDPYQASTCTSNMWMTTDYLQMSLERPTWSGEWPVIGMTELINWPTIDQLKQYQKSSVNMNKDNYKSNASKTTAFVMLPIPSHIDKTEQRWIIYYIYMKYCRESRQLQYCSTVYLKLETCSVQNYLEKNWHLSVFQTTYLFYSVYAFTLLISLFNDKHIL